MMQSTLLTQITAAESLRDVQERYCHTRGIPCFTATIYCPFCARNVYAKVTLEHAATQHITKCPHCDRSFSE